MRRFDGLENVVKRRIPFFNVPGSKRTGIFVYVTAQPTPAILVQDMLLISVAKPVRHLGSVQMISLCRDEIRGGIILMY